MDLSLTNTTEVYNYLVKHMTSLTFRANAQHFLPGKALHEVTQRTVIEHIISKDKEMALSSHEAGRFINIVHQTACKLFATCMYCEMPPSYLKHLLDGGLSDDDFPLIADKHPVWSEKYSRPSVRHFLDNQKRFNAVFFEPDSFKDLDDSRPIPVDFDEEEPNLLGKGAFGEVWKVRIHRDQHSFDCDEVQGEVFAMKVIQHEKSMAREKKFNNDTKNLKHGHLMKCYTSWKFGAKFHMIYELAKSNLEEFMQKTPFSGDNTALNNAWLIKQMCGLAGALRAVHTQKVDDNNRLGVPTASEIQTRSGYIHDIKPDNILVFLYEESVYWFRLSDFSCAKVVDFIASISGQHVNSHCTTSKTGTPDFRPPESMKAKAKTSRPYDLWSLGCVYLELMVWFLQGYPSLEAFREDRRGFAKPNGVEDEAFYFTIEVNANPKVQLRRAVKEKISELSKICPSDLRPLLDVIPSLLHIEPKKRLTATSLVQKVRYLDTSPSLEFVKASSRNTKTLNVSAAAQLGLPQNEDSGSGSDDQFVFVQKPTDGADE